MTYSQFIAKLNWRQILIHFVAFSFFAFAFTTLSFLSNTQLIDIARQNNQDFELAVKETNLTATDLVNFTIWTSLSWSIGILVAFVMSLAISIKRKWFWLNSVIVLVLVLTISRFGSLGWPYIKRYLWLPGSFFSPTAVEFIINGIVLLSVGILLFLLRKPNQFIEYKK